MNVQIARRGDPEFCLADELEMYRLRYQVFRERLNWEMPTVGNMEFDRFDRCDPVYVLAREEEKIHGCWRLLPTTGPNMLRDVFPELLYGAEAPCDEATWELSRFAVKCHSMNGAFGFGKLPVKMMQETVKFAQHHGIQRYVTVTTIVIERLLRHLGLQYERFGPPIQVGVERAVALSFKTDLKTMQALSEFQEDVDTRAAA